NNMRDARGDRESGKHTLASRMSLGAGKAFQCAMVILAMMLVVAYMALTYNDRFWYLPAALCLLNVPLTLQIKERKAADKLIKVLSFSTLVMVVVFSVVLNV